MIRAAGTVGRVTRHIATTRDVSWFEMAYGVPVQSTIAKGKVLNIGTTVARKTPRAPHHYPRECAQASQAQERLRIVHEARRGPHVFCRRPNLLCRAVFGPGGSRFDRARPGRPPSWSKCMSKKKGSGWISSRASSSSPRTTSRKVAVRPTLPNAVGLHHLRHIYGIRGALHRAEELSGDVATAIESAGVLVSISPAAPIKAVDDPPQHAQ